MKFPEEIARKIESFAIVIDNSGNKEYVEGDRKMRCPLFFDTEEEMDAWLEERGLFRKGTEKDGYVYDPAYPYRKPRHHIGEKLVGTWYPPGRAWIPGMDRDIMWGHPADRMADEWMKENYRPEDDRCDGHLGFDHEGLA